MVSIRSSSFSDSWRHFRSQSSLLTQFVSSYPILLFFLLLTTAGLLVDVGSAKCIFGHTKGQEYVVEQTYHSSDNLKFVYSCQSKKFDPQSPEFFYYQLDSCTAANVTYKPGETWRNGAFMYECFFRVSKDEGSISEVRHIGCFVQEYLIEKDKEALIGNYRFACDELGLHPITCISTKEGIEIKPGDSFEYGLDSYTCNETDTGLSLEERTKEEECVLSGRVAVAYLIDTSESIKESQFDAIVRPALAKELGSLPPSFLTRILVYSTRWQSHTDWFTMDGTSKTQLEEYSNTMPFLGEGTMTAAALLNTSNLFADVEAEAKFIVLLTDGEARDKDRIPFVVRELSKKAIKVVSVGIGSEIKAEELEEYGYSVIELQGLQDLEKALGEGVLRCKIFERLVKIQEARKQCSKWADDDIPMEPKFLPSCPLSMANAAGDDSMEKDPTCTDVYEPPPPGPGWKNCQLNSGADVCFYTKFVGIRYGGEGGKVFRSRSQCCYGDGTLISEPDSGAGTADKASQLYVHIDEDLRPYEYCREAGMLDLYNLHRPPGINNPNSVVPKN